jgi:hypothetical protein
MYLTSVLGKVFNTDDVTLRCVTANYLILLFTILD